MKQDIFSIFYSFIFVDYLTISSETGKAMKAMRPGRVIGYAVTNQNSRVDHVEILV